VIDQVLERTGEGVGRCAAVVSAASALMVNGTADLLTIVADARQLALGLPDARPELVRGAGHMVMLERAQRLAALLCGCTRDETAGGRAA
jgi:hypothetical protein